MVRSARTSGDWADAADRIAGTDAVARQLLDRHGPPNDIALTRREERFEALARAIAYQQLSGRAAGTIFGRVRDLVGTPMDADAVAERTHEERRSAGLSNAKVRALTDLSERSIRGDLRLGDTARMTDAAAISHLCQVRGIGPWTAHMFLMFDLGRTDVWPVGDLAVRAGYARAHGLEVPPTEKEMANLGDPYAPHRSVMAWWCWREVDTDNGPW